MSKRRLTSLILTAFLLTACGEETKPEAQNPQAFTLTEAQRQHLVTMIDGFVARQGHPNFIIGVVKGEELVWHHGSTGAGREVDEDTYFHAGAVFRIVTATALLRLVEEGELSIDDEAATWLPEAEATLSPPGKPAITLRHLLSHSSGLPQIGYGDLLLGPNQNLTEADILAALEGVELDFDPGTELQSSPMDYVLVGLILERASGIPFRDFATEQVLEPLGMTDTHWRRPIERVAPGYRYENHGGYRLVDDLMEYGIVEPGRGAFTTLRDLGRLAAHGLGHGRVLSAETLAMAQSPHVSTPDDNQAGLGWFMQDMEGMGKLVVQSDSQSGYSAFLGALPEEDLAVVVMAGTGGRGDLAELQSMGVATLAHLVAPELGRVPMPSTTEPKIVESLGQKLLALIKDPTMDQVEASFGPEVELLLPLEEVVEEVVEEFEKVAEAAGACTSYDVFEDRGYGDLILHLTCAKVRLSATIVPSPTVTDRLFWVYLRVL